MPWKVPILNVVDAFTTALIETLLALFLSGSGEVEGLSNAIEAWQFVSPCINLSWRHSSRVCNRVPSLSFQIVDPKGGSNPDFEQFG